MKKFTFLAQVLNKPGVLNKITMMVRRKMYNIDTLTASPTLDPSISNITVVFNSESTTAAEQVKAQLARIVEVIAIEELTEKNSIQQELMLMKVKTKSPKTIEEICKGIMFSSVFKSSDFQIIRAVGSKSELNELISKFPKGDVLEIAQTGITSMRLS